MLRRRIFCCRDSWNIYNGCRTFVKAFLRHKKCCFETKIWSFYQISNARTSVSIRPCISCLSLTIQLWLLFEILKHKISHYSRQHRKTFNSYSKSISNWQSTALEYIFTTRQLFIVCISMWCGWACKVPQVWSRDAMNYQRWLIT